MKLQFVYGICPVFIFCRNSLGGKWQAGVTVANIIWLLPEDYNAISLDATALVEHEKIHVKQFYRMVGVNMLFELFQKGKIRLESEAYAYQINYLISHGSTRTKPELINWAADTLFSNYGLSRYSLQDCKEMILTYL